MAQPIRHLSARPHLLVDTWGFRLRDPTDGTYVGVPGPFGRERVVYALPLNGPLPAPVGRAVVDTWGMAVRDPQGNLLGDRASAWINRILSAQWTADTRRL